MARTLSAGTLVALGRQNYIVEDLIEIYTGAGVNYFYSTGNSNITVVTPTQVHPGAAFTINNSVSILGNLVESFIPTESEITLTLDTLDNAIVGNIETNLQKCRLVIYKMFRDSSTNVADTTNLISIFDGTATSMDLVGGETGQTLQVKYKSIFSNLDIVKNRTNSQLEPATGVKMYWGSIVWS